MAKNPPGFSPQHLPDRAIISIEGDGAAAWLDNLLTCEIGDAAYGALLSPQGKILHDMFVVQRDGVLLIDCARSQRDALLQKLKLYRLRAKLTIEVRDDLHVGVSPTPTLDGFADPRHAALGYRIISGARLPDGRDYNAHRLSLGFADSDEIGVELHYPHEANFDQFGGVNFKKGCYVGQEVVSRMQHRGTVRNRMLPVMSADTGAMMSGDQTIGTVLSSDGQRGLALVRLDRLADARAPLIVSGQAVRISVPDWIGYTVAIPEAVQ